MRIALAQIDFTVGDFGGNLQKIEDCLMQAGKKGCDLCVFPEMAISGYPPQDLLFHNKFIRDNLAYLDHLISKIDKVAAIIGYVRPVPNALEHRLENVAALISGQEIVSTHTKSRLTVNGACDGSRYFEPASTVRAVDFKGEKLGICFYNDISDGGDVVRMERMFRDPVSDLVEQGAELIVAIDAWPFDYRKRGERIELLRETARRHSRSVLYVNQVGCADEFILDGGSMVVGPSGDIIGRARELGEDLIVVDTGEETGDIHSAASGADAALLDALVLGTRDYTRKSGFNTTAIDLGADLESSVVAAIAARAIGPENVFGVVMPCRNSEGRMVDDAINLAARLQIHVQIVPIDELLGAYLTSIKSALRDLSVDRLENRSETRIRAMILMSIANAYGHLVLSTFNRTQLFIGETILGGDMAGGLAVLSDVSKSLVERITAVINKNGQIIPQPILDRTSVSRMSTFQVGEGGPGSHRIVDSVLERLVDQNLSAQATIAEGFDETLVMEVARLVRVKEHKRRQSPPGLNISARTHFGPKANPLGHHFEI